MEKKKKTTNQSSWRMVFKRFRRHKLAMCSLCLFVVITVLALLSPIIVPYDPNKITGGFGQAPDFKHLLGTDQIGRDMLARILYGTKISLFVGFMATLISTAIGVTLGLISGFCGGWIDIIIMRLTDVVMSFPYILLVLVAAAVFSPGLWNIILILGFVDWPGVARLVRGNVLSLREKNFIKSDQVAGMPAGYILFSEILPNTIAPVLVYATSVFAISILDEAALSFLGMGVQSPMASLGNILNGAQSITVLTNKFWLWVPAGLMIVLLIVSINFIGDALRDAVDPTGKS